jgi:hypothetical protein
MYSLPMAPTNDTFPNPYRTWATTARSVAVLGVLVACVPLATTQAPPALFAGLGAMVATVAVILWLSFALVARGVEGQLAAFRRGEALARWEVSAERYEAWAVERKRRLRALPWVLGATVVLAGATAVCLFAADGEWAVAAVLAGVTLAVALGAGYVVDRVAARGLRPRGREPVLVTVGHRCAFMNGVVYPWRGLGVRWVGAEALADPPCLRVRYIVEGEAGAAETHLDLPCPPEALPLAKIAAEKLRAP